MMPRLATAVAVGAMLAAHAAAAQETNPVAFAIYYQCDQTREARADTVYQQVFGPIFDRHIEAGHLTTWGWGAHLAGGPWRRFGYLIGTDRDVMLDARNEIIEELQTEHAAGLRELNTICPAHDDYIWNSVATSQEPADVGQDRPPAALSTYYECSIAREARADELVTDVFAPIFNRHVSAGHIASWSWLAHQTGGKFRRLAVFDGADHKTILNTFDQIVAEMQTEHPAATTEFLEICSAHEDYMWNVVITRP